MTIEDLVETITGDISDDDAVVAMVKAAEAMLKTLGAMKRLPLKQKQIASQLKIGRAHV